MLQRSKLSFGYHFRHSQSNPPARPTDEILIIDDGSTHNTAAVASKYPVRVIRRAKNKGLAAARNTALANADFPLLAAFDAEAVADPQWLSSLLEHFQNPKVAGAGGRLLEHFCLTPPDLWRSIQLSRDLGEVPIETSWPMPKRLGGFGTVYRTDSRMLTHVFLQAGRQLVFEPRAVMRHMRRDAFASVLRTSWRWDFYTHYFNGGYNYILLRQHAAARRRSLLHLDAALPFIHSYHDLRYRFSSQRLPRLDPGPGSSSYPLYFPRPFRSLLRRSRAAQSAGDTSSNS